MELVGDAGELDLDAVASVRPEPEVAEAMRPWLSFAHSHPDSPHPRGARARLAIAQARAEVARLIAAPFEGIVFTSGATESNNLAIHGCVRDESAAIAIAAHEPAALLHPCRSLARAGTRVAWLDVGRDGVLAPTSLPDEPLALFAFTHGHPELGALQQARALVERARSLGAASLVDLSWTYGRTPTEVECLGSPEMVSISFHRMGGPMGVGALALREGVALRPLLAGGPQEGGARPGSPNLAGIVGAGVAARRAVQALDARSLRLARLGALLYAGALSIPGVRAYGAALDRRLPGHVGVLVDGVDGEALVTALAARGVLVATGSPCGDVAGLPSATLRAAGYDREEARSAVVLCVPPVGGPDEAGIARAVALFAAEVERLRRVAGLVARPGG